MWAEACQMIGSLGKNREADWLTDSHVILGVGEIPLDHMTGFSQCISKERCRGWINLLMLSAKQGGNRSYFSVFGVTQPRDWTHALVMSKQILYHHATDPVFVPPMGCSHLQGTVPVLIQEPDLETVIMYTKNTKPVPVQNLVLLQEPKVLLNFPGILAGKLGFKRILLVDLKC